MRKVKAPFWIFFCGIFFALIAPLLRAQVQVPQGFRGSGFQYAYRDPKTLEIKAIFTGKNAKQVSGSQVLVSEFGMQTLRNGNTNQIELIAEAPECLIDRSTSAASSPGAVKAFTATTNLYIQGVGFFCQQTNSLFVISNNVETVIHKESFKTNSAASSTNDVLKIFADHFQFLYESNLVTYTGNVRVNDSQMELTCDVLNIFLTTNRSIHQIFAEHHVVIVNKKDNSRATGGHAVYTVEPDREIIELTENPFWTDGPRAGKADKFVFDRTKNVFRAEQHAIFQLPREQLGRLDFVDSNAPTSTNTAGASPVVISSALMTLQFPPTNGPIQEIIAETNVLIYSESDQSRATANRAVYRVSTGLLELTGNPEWKMKQSEITAEILVVGKTNRFFGARTNVSLKMPASLFGKTFAAKTNSTTANQMVEVLSEDFSFSTNIATFQQNVRAKTVDGDLSKTSLICNFLQVAFGASNQLERITARENVFLEQIPGAALNSKVLQKSVACDSLTLDRSPETGLLKMIHAENNVVGEQIERTANGKATERILAGEMKIRFSPTTNQVEQLVADHNVFAEKSETLGAANKTSSAKGEHAVYNSASGLVELTGNPSAISEGMLLQDATVLRFDLKTGKMSASGRNKITPLNTTNNFKSLLKPKS